MFLIARRSNDLKRESSAQAAMKQASLAILVALGLIASGCLAEPEKPLEPEADADGDGLPNGWEIERGLDPLNGSDGIVCQGEARFCLRTYDNHSFPETHNSFSTVEDEVWMAVNHYTALEAQWEGGIRAYMIDIHHLTKEDTEQKDVRFCHGDPDSTLFYPCIYSEVDAFAWLGQLNSLMNNSSGDVVTILIENYVPAEHVEYLFESAGMIDKAYVHKVGEAWPTLGDLVLSGKNLVVFWDYSDDERYPWLHHAWTHSWDTPYGEDEEEEMSCTVGRGSGETEAWHLNNWLNSIFGFGDPTRSEAVNDYDKLLARAIECWQIFDDRPTFIAVDFWEDGEVVNVTMTLNEMEHWSDDVPPHP